VIPVDAKVRPKYLGMLLHRPKGSWLRVQINQKELVNDEAAETEMYWCERTLGLTGIDLGDAVIVEILSNPIMTVNDSRKKRAKVRWIKLLAAQPSASFVDVPIGSQFVFGIKEMGFWNEETYGNETCRWTDGTGWMTVPLGAKKPRALALSAFIPSPPGYSVRVSVNGKKLYDGPVRSNSIWSVELPLTDLELGDRVHIELMSSTFLPTQVDAKTKDARVLGIRLLHMRLISAEPAAEQK